MVSVVAAQWLLNVPPGLNLTNAKFCPHSVFTCFAWTSEQIVGFTAQDGQHQMKVPLDIHTKNLKIRSIIKLFSLKYEAAIPTYAQVTCCLLIASQRNLSLGVYQPITLSLTDQAHCILQTHTVSGGCVQGESKTLTQISDASSSYQNEGKNSYR